MPNTRVVAVVAFVSCAACGGSNPPPAPGGPGGGAGTITGRERIGWLQQAADAAQFAAMDFAIYVDGARTPLPGDTCTAASGGGYDCSAPLPPLTAGPHTLELVSFITADGSVIESDRSAPLSVTVASATRPADVAPPVASTVVTSDGHRLRASIVAADLDDPTDVAIAPDGRVFVAERAGRVRIFEEGGAAAEEPALELAEVSDTEEAGLMSLALDPGFARNGLVYLSYTAEGRDGPLIHVARYRERGGRLAEGATIARERASGRPYATARIGPDGMLFVGVAAGTDPHAARNPSSSWGKILRLRADGTTPADNPRRSTVYSTGFRNPRALAWQTTTGRLWAIDADDEGDELNAIVAGGDYGWPVVRGTASDGRSVPAALVLPPGADVAGAGVVPPKSGLPLAGDLLLASRGAEDLLRVRIDGARPGLVEGLLQGRYGRIGAVAVSADGAIVIATANRDTWGPSRDALIRLTPHVD